MDLKRIILLLFQFHVYTLILFSTLLLEFNFFFKKKLKNISRSYDFVNNLHMRIWSKIAIRFFPKIELPTQLITFRHRKRLITKRSSFFSLLANSNFLQMTMKKYHKFLILLLEMNTLDYILVYNFWLHQAWNFGRIDNLINTC